MDGIIIYRDSKHKDEVAAKMRNDESMGQLYQQSLGLITPGTGFIMGGFSRLKIYANASCDQINE